MRPTTFIIYILFIIATFPVLFASGQEQAGPLKWNPFLSSNKNTGNTATPRSTSRTTVGGLSLPFFEDFTNYSPIPDSTKWVDFQVYINNTMGVSPISRGVATFDDLNGIGIPYDSFSNTATRYADSLTSQPIDLSADSVGDSLYLSFFYQPQGNGFYPASAADSLILYLKNRYGDFIKVWAVPGNVTLQPFQQVMIPITDTLDYHAGFQFRFVNIASLMWADAVWNVDYIRLDRQRSYTDTTVSDVAFTANPSFLLNDYTSMPYGQFKVNPTSEIVSTIADSIRNDTSIGQSVNYAYTVRDTTGGFPLAGTGTGFTSITLPGYQTVQVAQPLYIPGYPGHLSGTPVVYETKFFLQSTATTGPVVNDSIIQDQIFDNYLAYDDGTAEKSYYLNLFPSTPGRIAIEYHLNKPDTLRGMAIYFGRQLPYSNSKPFEINIYSALAGVNGYHTDNIVYSSDQYYPAYEDGVNHFWIYTLDSPVYLPAGTFYAGTTQSDDDGSDSLYYGLDVNRVGSNHAYFNVLGVWNPSLISGAIMMRPIIGNAVSGSAVGNVTGGVAAWNVMPNPAKDIVTFQYEGDGQAAYTITDVQGRSLLRGMTANGKAVNIEALKPGMYLVTLSTNGIPAVPKKIIKL